jgi:hypothetical protein
VSSRNLKNEVMAPLGAVAPKANKYYQVDLMKWNKWKGNVIGMR